MNPADPDPGPIYTKSNAEVLHPGHIDVCSPDNMDAGATSQLPPLQAQEISPISSECDRYLLAFIGPSIDL